MAAVLGSRVGKNTWDSTQSPQKRPKLGNCWMQLPEKMKYMKRIRSWWNNLDRDRLTGAKPRTWIFFTLMLSMKHAVAKCFVYLVLWKKRFSKQHFHLCCRGFLLCLENLHLIIKTTKALQYINNRPFHTNGQWHTVWSESKQSWQTLIRKPWAKLFLINGCQWRSVDHSGEISTFSFRKDGWVT